MTVYSSRAEWAAAQGGAASAATPKTVTDPRIVVGRVTVTKSTTSHRTVK